MNDVQAVLSGHQTSLYPIVSPNNSRYVPSGYLARSLHDLVRLQLLGAVSNQYSDRMVGCPERMFIRVPTHIVPEKPGTTLLADDLQSKILSEGTSNRVA